MMFQGSENVGKGEHSILILNNGGNANGTTNADRTNYFETLPANQLELGIFLEADRMRALNVTQANFDNQRHTVQEERRLNYDNRPYGRTYEAVLDTAYDNFAYKHSTIGSMEDLNAVTVDDARAFFRTYYAPNNAVLSLVGDFQSEGFGTDQQIFCSIHHSHHLRHPTRRSRNKQRAPQTIEDALRRPHIDISLQRCRANARFLCTQRHGAYPGRRFILTPLPEARERTRDRRERFRRGR
jgi:secreted Zn-dependent insulinase-like peptidase